MNCLTVNSAGRMFNLLGSLIRRPADHHINTFVSADEYLRHLKLLLPRLNETEAERLLDNLKDGKLRRRLLHLRSENTWSYNSLNLEVLSHLDLEGQNLSINGTHGQSGIHLLAILVRDSRSLATFSVAFCGLHAIELGILALGLCQNTSLKLVNFSHNKLTKGRAPPKQLKQGATGASTNYPKGNSPSGALVSGAGGSFAGSVGAVRSSCDMGGVRQLALALHSNTGCRIHSLKLSHSLHSSWDPLDAGGQGGSTSGQSKKLQLAQFLAQALCYNRSLTLLDLAGDQEMHCRLCV